MSETKSRTTRSVRKSGVVWVDNEVLDRFGDDLGAAGIAAYMVMARYCDDKPGATTVRELASRVGMSKDSFARALKRMVELGLLIEDKGPTPMSESNYTLADVQDLVKGRAL